MGKPKLTYANVASTLALVVALGGTGAYAAGRLAPGSVGEPQLRPGAVTAEKLRTNAVTAAKVKAGAVKQGKLANGSVTAAKIAAGSVGAGSLQADAVTSEKIGPDAVTGEKVLESTLSQVPSAAKADLAALAESANPLAFARVNSDGTLDGALSKAIASAGDGSLAGIYCIAAQGFNPRGAQVTPQLASAGSGEATATVRIGGTADCPAPQVEVQTFEAGTRARVPFFVTLYR